ncbi:septum formation protein Maf [Wenzhouxiangella sp. AB-CW3]|uniref:Maf family protein n=1 Tax=Wenzhouxiangella sp. AB-CW3 TaxID=2771012 RepID=UPI00168BCA61|nr:nucleoside triphosphate pyrophosphatase [Wenzhouxiangella sp. AB-CW3]QOC23995.1 septum formation protein Maf [Wenzhouxiangella sp. AB-CW3]
MPERTANPPPEPTRSKLILASGSPYRRQLLERLGLPFSVLAPDIDEAAETAASSAELAQRLALLKARAVSRIKPDAIVIGSDQVADCEGRQLGKPGTPERAAAQLRDCSGREVVFHTSVAVIQGVREAVRNIPTRVRVKNLSAEQIKSYVERDRPLDCAGAMKSESLGIALAESIDNQDPTALIGLPLIALVELLEEFGIGILDGPARP